MKAPKSNQGPERKRGSSIASHKLAERIMGELRPRIEELEEAALEEKSDGQEPLSQDSRRGLVRFLDEIADTVACPVPELDLTYAGNIRAEWEFSPDELIILEFVDFFRLRFVFFRPDPDSPGRVSASSGEGAVSGFLEDHPDVLDLLQRLAAVETRGPLQD